MLSKLCKHELMAAGRMMAVFYGILAAATVLLSVIGAIHQNFAEIGAVVDLSFIFYIVTMVVLFVISFAYLCIRFYQTMYSSQGYLTHTMPVETSAVLNVKVLVSFGYQILTVALCLLSLFTVCMVLSSGEAWEILKLAIQQTLNEVAEEAGMAGAAAAIYIYFVAALFMAQLNAMLMFFAGSSIGQLAHHSKAAYGIAASIGLYYLTQMVSLILIGIAYLVTRSFALQLGMKWVVAAAFGMELFWIVFYYLISRVIVIKHLNLE